MYFYGSIIYSCHDSSRIDNSVKPVNKTMKKDIQSPTKKKSDNPSLSKNRKQNRNLSSDCNDQCMNKSSNNLSLSKVTYCIIDDYI